MVVKTTKANETSTGMKLPHVLKEKTYDEADTVNFAAEVCRLST
jgi:hypothetical protein